MSEAIAQHELSLTPFDARPVAATLLLADRQFTAGLAVAIVLHGLIFASFLSSGGRRLGDPGGAADAISIDMVTDADLKRLGTVADTAAGLPAPSPAPAQTTPLPPEPSPPPQPPAPQPAQAPASATPPPDTTAALPEKPARPPEREDERFLRIPTQAALPHSLDPPKPLEPVKPARPARPEQAQPHQPKSAPKRMATLDLSLPPSIFMAPHGGGGVGVERAAGVTRSGENDTFARGVIGALQRTMPQLRDSTGRVTVRITLDKDGSLVRTEVLRPSSVAGLDQSVVFATRQTSFPFPPRNANAADLTFIVTYIYR